MTAIDVIVPLGSFVLSVISFLILQYNNNRKRKIERDDRIQKEAIEKTKFENKIAILEKDMEHLQNEFEKGEIKTLEAITKLSEKMDNVVDNVNKTIIELLTNKK